MLYRFLKVIVNWSVRGYFRRINVIGRERLELPGVIYVSNHPGAMMDPVIVAMLAKKPLHFIAGAEWFGSGFKDWLFKKQFNMIPVYRPWLVKDGEKVSNADMFKACYESLSHGERIIIYPEASSKTVPWVRPLKTGAARIKLGADQFIGKGSDVKIIPIGINYVNPHRFYTRVTVVVGEPIAFPHFDAQLSEKELALAMTDVIKAKMEECVLHLENEEHYPIICQLFKLMTESVKNDIKLASNDIEAEFKAKKEIINAVNYYKSAGDEDLLVLEQKIDDYIRVYEGLGFRQFNPFDKSIWYAVKLMILIILFFPIFILGAVLNGLPYFFARYFFRKFLLDKVSSEDKDGSLNHAFTGSLAYLTGFAMFLVWYAFVSVAAAQLYTWWIAAPLAIFIAYQSGKLVMFYWRWLSRLYNLMKWQLLSHDVKSGLMIQRRNVMDSLNALKMRYIELLAS
ncbi:MAG: 1-acyl-sn-glycerol-3-phosphate acyltransferase [Salibacteraceae bacterium]